MRLFLDANVLLTAAHNPSGKAALVIELAKTGHWSLVTSSYAREEARRNLATKRPQALAAFASLIEMIDLAQHHVALRVPPGLPAKDRPIFQGAVASQATHLLTGDLKHFGYLMNRPEATFGIVVQTIADFLRSAARPRAGPPDRSQGSSAGGAATASTTSASRQPPASEPPVPGRNP